MSRPTYSFQDATVIVTGGSSGIGRATALRFGDAGATVINADIDPDPRDIDAETPTHEAITDGGGTAEYVPTDVSDPDDVECVVEAARSYGGVDVMINNAGRYLSKPFVEVEPADLAALIEVNVHGVFFGTQAAARDMIDRDEPGTILNTASISSTMAQPEQVQYDATKGAVGMITRGAALELASHGIRVNAIAPGQIATEFIEGLTERQHALAETEGHYKPIPLGRAGTPEDVAGPYLFLASEDAAYITGELVFVDGGWQIV